MFRGPTLQLFRIAGIPVGAHWSFLVAIAWMAFRGQGLAGVGFGMLVFASVLLHELGHSLVARRLRVPIEGIDLHLFGGVAKMGGPPRSPQDEMWIAIAGPLVSLALGAAFTGWFFLAPKAAPAWVPWIAGANWMLGIFNLLPALPMDGGRVLRAWLAQRKGFATGTRLAVRLNRVLALGMAVYGWFESTWMLAMALLVWWMGSAELAQVRRHEVLRRFGFGDAWDPWARYQRAADRSRVQPSPSHRMDAQRRGAAAPSCKALEPEVLAPAQYDRAPGAEYQRFERDPWGAWTVETHHRNP